MSTRCQIKKTGHFLIGYICSKCQAINIAEGILVALGEAGGQYAAEKAANTAYQNALVVLNGMHDKPVFVEEQIETLRFGGSFLYRFEKLGIPCPCCNHLERWQIIPQGNGNTKGMKWDAELERNFVIDIQPDNCPTVFDSVYTLEYWKRNILSQQAIKYGNYWNANPQDAQNILNSIASLDNELCRLENEKRSIGNIIEAMTIQYNQKKVEATSFPLFSSNRRILNTEAKTLYKQIQAQMEKDKEERSRISANIAEIRKKKNELLCANPGIMCKEQTYKSNRSNLRTAVRLD